MINVNIIQGEVIQQWLDLFEELVEVYEQYNGVNTAPNLIDFCYTRNA